MRRFIVLPAALLIAAAGFSQINSPAPDGYLLRGERAMLHRNWHQTIDQLSNIAPGQLRGGDRAEAALTQAVATLLSGHPAEARRLLTAFLNDFPGSPHAVTARMALADCDFYEGHYAEALDAYDMIDSSALNLAAQDDYTYRRSFCLMMNGDYDRALAGFESLAGAPRYTVASHFYQAYIHYAQGSYAKAKSMFDSCDTSTPPGDRAPYYLAQIAYIDGDYSKALSLARRHLDDIEEYRPELTRIAGESLYHLGDESEAVTWLTRYVNAVDNPQSSALYMLGVSYYKSGEYERAIKTLDRVTASDDAMGQSAYLYIGQSYLKLGNLNSALLALEKAYRMDYDRSVQETAFYNYAVARSEGGQTPFGSSVTMFEDFLKRYPRSRYAPEVQEYLVTGYMTDNNYEKALASIQAIKNPSAAILAAKQRVLYILGSRDVAAGRTDSAIKRFTEARAIKGGDRMMANECLLWLGDCYSAKGDYARASRMYTDYLKGAAAAKLSNRELATYNLGYSLFGEKKYADARRRFENVISSPGSLDRAVVADAHARVGDCYYYSSQFDRAADSYDTAYSLNPATGDYPLFQKAMMRGLTRDYRGKIELLDELVAKYPTTGMHPSVLLEKAESYIALGRPGDAVDLYRELVRRYPATAQGRNGYLQLAVTLMSQGDKSHAIDTYKKVISTYPTSEEARVASDDLKRILADEGRLEEFTRFIASVPNAPKFEVSEIDGLTFQAAEKAYLNDNTDLTRLKDYISRYPGGRYEAQALSYLATQSAAVGNDDEAYSYASALVEKYPDVEVAEDALAIKGNVELARGDGEQALATFRRLASKASAPRNIHTARMGIMRVSHELGKYKDVIEMADLIMASPAMTEADRPEVVYTRAYALDRSGDPDGAVKAWETIAPMTDNLYGAKSAYYLAEHYYNAGSLKKARSTVEKLIESNTPHSYWLARGYILLSDIYRKQGDTFEAKEYLQSLKDNYPGTESDIFMMIDERLK